MKYLRLFVPIPIAILAIILSANYFEGPNKIISIVLKGGLLIYYLRLGNAGTPLINTLTVVLVSMAVGEYLLWTNIIIAQVILIISSLALGLLYFFRQIINDARGKLVKLKMVAVSIFGLVNILSLYSSMNLVPMGIGTLFLTFVYFYDRLNATANL